MSLPVALAALLIASPAAQAGASASAFKPETKKGANYWNAQSALDGQNDTCWMVPGESKNVGEYIIVDVPKVDVDKLALYIGWGKSEEAFKDHARIKKVRVEAMAYDDNQELKPVGTPATAEYADQMGLQVVDIPNIKAEGGAGGKVKITVEEIYEGEDYPFICLSELVIHLGEFDAPLQVLEAPGAGAKEALTDGNAKTTWMGPAADAVIKVQSTGLLLSTVQLTPGPKTHARPKKIEVVTNGRSITHELPDTAGPHALGMPAVLGYVGTWKPVEIKVLEVYPGTKDPGTLGVVELKGKAVASDGL
jgi:hypothetical protein